jgi:hypothetical protein
VSWLFQGGKLTPLAVRLNATWAVLDQLASRDTTVVWRTVGFQRYLFNSQVNEGCNLQAKTYIDQHRRASWDRGIASNLTYVAWGEAIRPQSKRGERIMGDNDIHFGLDAQYQYLQMLINTLVQQWSSKSRMFCCEATTRVRRIPSNVPLKLSIYTQLVCRTPVSGMPVYR